MNTLSRRILDAMLTDVLRLPCPERIPRSGAEGAAVDCFSVMVDDPAGEPYLNLRATDGSVAQALQWDGQRFTIDTTITHEEINPSRLEVTHFFGLATIKYEGLTQLALGRITRWPYLWLRVRKAGDAVLQSTFNLRSLGSQARIDALRDLLRCCMDNDSGASAMEIMSYRHGTRWVGYPDWRDHHRRLDTLLGLLYESGEIAKDGVVRYKATGRTVAIIEEAESEDRRHRASQRLQRVLVALTIVTAVFTAAQANLFKLPMLADWSTKDAAPAPDSKARLQLTLEPDR